MNCNAKSLCITPIMLLTMSKNPALSQKVLENWLRLPERQELFAGLEYNGIGGSVTKYKIWLGSASY